MELEPAEIEIVGLDEAVLMRGYLYWACPGEDALMDIGDEDDPWPVGFGPEDCPPCSGDCVAELEQGYLVISEHAEPDLITRLDGWQLRPAGLPQFWTVESEGLYLRILRLRDDGQALLVACS